MLGTSRTLRGIGFLVLGLLTFSLQDVAVKWIGGNYPILEIVLFRTLTALPLTLLFFRLEGGRGLPKTRQLRLEVVRGLSYFLSYTTGFMGLASLSLADVAAVRFSGPIMITLLSVLLLRERVGLQRWLALVVGFVGVLLIVRPGAGTFNLGSIFILLSVLFYALSAILTRRLQTTDSSATMSYFSTLVYMVGTAILVPLSLFVGETPNAHPSIAFLFRAWAVPSLRDATIMAGLGLTWAGGMYFIARAYSVAQASAVAPFEYAGLPINVLWGFILWRELPGALTWVGAALALSSGLYSLYQERRERASGKLAQNLP